MQIGRFFSLSEGRVGQFLSPRVLLVRTPFRPLARQQEVCYFGFDRLNQAQKFTQNLALAGYSFQLRRSQVMPQPYEVRLPGHRDLARTLAYWDRLDRQQTQANPASERRHPGTSPLAA
ncbi:hypothetical protein ACN4EK_15435 [Pantanalinema rosaneae CENA516]|uniref:hypothetical protein n=1 Tax=Pantanalinema rosaneae TaxID=1620701 RepID=UPI003D6E3FD6